jgi:hypothetical protein
MYRGDRGRFAELLDWPSLNRLLLHDPDRIRLRVVRDGKLVQREQYSEVVRTARDAKRTRISVERLSRVLATGATLIIGDIDEVHEPLAALAQSFERILREPVFMNVYFGHSSSSAGFGLHWDGYDIFVLQIAGEKIWSVYPMGRKFPLHRDVELRHESPEGAQRVEYRLCDGDVLYFPRGWWHSAQACDVASLHVTVAIRKRTAVDYIQWLADRMTADEYFRRDVPRFSDPDRLTNYGHELVTRLAEAAGTDYSISEFLEASEVDAATRPSFSLPYCAGVTPKPAPPDALIRLIPTRTRWQPADEGGGRLLADGRSWDFPAPLSEVVELLISNRECTFSGLSCLVGGPESKAVTDLNILFMELCADGLIAIEPTTRAP